MTLYQHNDTRALAIRLRKHALRMTSRAKSSHVGSAFSMADIIAVLYGGALNVDPARPEWDQRDRFILSKGHAGSCLYAALMERGFFSEEVLDTYYGNGSILSGHVSHKGVPGVEFSTGSLGHGLGVATGMALAGKMKGADHRVVCVLSDGECDEGSNWEAFLFAAHHKLDNLVAIIDYNKIQSLASVAETLALEPLADKLRAMNWAVSEVDGHDHAAMTALFGRLPLEVGRPSMIIAHTTKGKGVSFMEDTVLWHYRTAQGDEFEAAMAELDAIEIALTTDRSHNDA
ncbi:transketolase [Brevundimonas denitrificans]|uniref:Transketolase n=1 Tax=Brevundimonas denitrificans TaxID=1443434 RepID=A0ABQ6BFM8_9CAUL|nr:transketolase [Brevundimonas denitrificans]GLS00184.1 transketolase [Brevundimonas denitrificans]